jgi:predicted nucleic acid-binding protein
MQKIIVDTNVVVSSLIQRSYPYRIIYELFIDDQFHLCVSEELMLEYYEKLLRYAKDEHGKESCKRYVDYYKNDIEDLKNKLASLEVEV